MSEELHESPDAQTAHPLDPLSEAEVTTAREVLEAEKTLGDAIRYVKVVLDEPTKTELDEYDTHGLEPPRRAFIRLRDIDEKATYEAEVAVDRRELLSYSHVENVQPSITAGKRQFASVASRISSWRWSTPGLSATSWCPTMSTLTAGWLTG